jgi:uroporphyrinogen III methyltransferase / synthase
VEAGTLPAQRTIRAALGEIAAAAREQEVRAPAITVVGAVAALADVLAWLPEHPLAGTSVVVTRARAQASGLSRSLRELGARVIEAPAIRTRPLDGPALDPTPYDLICFTSANGVEGLFARLRAGGRDARSLAGAKIAAVGVGTAQALAMHGLVADIVPERSVAESLVEALVPVEVRRALIPRAREARDVLPDALRARGIEVQILPVYETVPQALSERVLHAALAADYVTFTSSSTVRSFLAAAGSAATFSARTRVVSIGPITSATLREHGVEPNIEAARHDVDGVLAAILDDRSAHV